MNYLGDFETGRTIFFPFLTYNAAGASVTITGLAVTDIEVYKGASMTQRSSDNGYALIDTDGIDLDSIIGFHGFTIDTSDNSDSGFFAAGNDYTVIVDAITVDSQTVRAGGRFSIEKVLGSANGVAGFAKNIREISLFTVTNAGFSPTATEMEATVTDDSGATVAEATVNHYVDCLIIPCTGALRGKRLRVNAYSLVGGRPHFTVTDKGEAFANGDTGIIV